MTKTRPFRPENYISVNDCLDLIAELDGENAKLHGLLKRAVKFLPQSEGQCSGYKCREPYCISCNSKESVEKYFDEQARLEGEIANTLLGEEEL